MFWRYSYTTIGEHINFCLLKLQSLKQFVTIHRCVVNTVVVWLHISGPYWCTCTRRKEGQVESKMGRWCDGRCQEVGGERNWKNAARNRDSQQKLLKKDLTQMGLLCQ